MNEINIIDNEQQILPIELSYLFAQLAPQDVEQFYQSYRLWSLQREIVTIQGQINELQQQIEHNAQLMQSVQPSPIALSALAQLQAYGVSDLDLLDRMLERGDSWLDHTVQLLTRCEELGVIRSNYNQWCENALEGAYDWITTMDQATPEPTASEYFDENVENIEITLIHKLMNEDDTAPRLPIIKADSTDIADQATMLPANKTAQSISTESDIIAEPGSSYGTTEAINLEDLKVPATMQEEDLDANQASVTSDQSTSTTKQIDTPHDLHKSIIEATKNSTNKRREDTIYQFRHLQTNISHDRDNFKESPIIIDSSISEITSLTTNYIEQELQQENGSEEQTATDVTITATNTVTAHTVKSSENTAEQREQATGHTTTHVHLQEDDLALPSVTNTNTPSTIWIESTITTAEEHPEQTLQEATTTDHKPGISWSDESIEPHQAQHKKQTGLLARLFRSHQ